MKGNSVFKNDLLQIVSNTNVISFTKVVVNNIEVVFAGTYHISDTYRILVIFGILLHW